MGFLKNRKYTFVSESEYRANERSLSISEIMDDKKEIKRLKKWLKTHKIKPKFQGPSGNQGPSGLSGLSGNGISYLLE